MYIAFALLVLAFCHIVRCPCLRVCGHRAPGIPLALLACACFVAAACTHTMLLSAVLAASCSRCLSGLVACLSRSHASFRIDGL